MKRTDYIDLSDGTQPFEGLIPQFIENMGDDYAVGKREGATDYLEVIDCEAVKDYIEENVSTPEHEGEFASFEGFILEKAIEGDEPVPPVPPVPPTPQINTIFYYDDGTNTESSDTKLTDSSYDTSKTLVGVEIGDCVTSIGDDAFNGCSGLTSVTIGNSVTSIGDYAFYFCSSLTSVTIGNSVAIIGNRVFYGCSGLTSVTIPNSVISIGNEAFDFSYDNTNPYTVILESEECKIDLVDLEGNVIYAFSTNSESVEIKASIIIPKGSSSSYRNHDDGWELYDNYISEAE